MHTCREVKALMSEALDDALGEERWQQLQAHIKSCRSCLRTWAAFREIDAMLRAAPMMAPPDGFVQRATAAAVASQRRRTWLIGVAALVGGGLVIALLTGLALLAESGALYYLLVLPAAIVRAPELLDTFASALLAFGEALLALVQTVQQMLFGPLFWPAVVTFALSWIFLLLTGYFGRRLMARRVQH